ncbi:MAG TPA: RDD family protein [Candidatus Nanoarchaeia archaeon]|nr:RDD family protein [Candidatus Nanoarchaeia archaeon]
MNTVPTWKKVIAFLLDLIGSFVVFGYIIALLTGNTSQGGFSLSGAPAFLLFAIVIVYFVVMNKFLGGTLGKRIFGIAGK